MAVRSSSSHRPAPSPSGSRDSRFLAAARARLPRQIMWALIIGGVSFGLALLTSH